MCVTQAHVERSAGLCNNHSSKYKNNFEEPKKHKLKFLVSLLRESHQICPILIDSLQDRVYNKYKKYPLSFKR